MKPLDKMFEARARLFISAALVAGIAFGVILSDAMGWFR